jgi:hypothetical protein
VGRLYVFDDRIRYSASPAAEPQAHGFEVSCADIKEVKKNRVFARPYGFHIRTKSENFDFIPASSEFEAILGTLGLINLDFTGSETIPRPDPIVEAVSACMARNVGSR